MFPKFIVVCSLLIAVATSHEISRFPYIANYASSYNAHTINHNAVPYTKIVPIAQVGASVEQIPIASSIATQPWLTFSNVPFTSQLNSSPIIIASVDRNVSPVSDDKQKNVLTTIPKFGKSGESQSTVKDTVQTIPVPLVTSSSQPLTRTRSEVQKPRSSYDPSNPIRATRLYQTRGTEREQELSDELAETKSPSVYASQTQIETQSVLRMTSKNNNHMQVFGSKNKATQLLNNQQAAYIDRTNTSPFRFIQEQQKQQFLNARRNYEAEERLTKEDIDSITIQAENSKEKEIMVDSPAFSSGSAFIPNLNRKVFLF